MSVRSGNFSSGNHVRTLGEGVAEEAADGGHEVVVELLAGGVAAVLRFGEVGGEVAEEVVVEHL